MIRFQGHQFICGSRPPKNKYSSEFIKNLKNINNKNKKFSSIYEIQFPNFSIKKFFLYNFIVKKTS